MPPRLILVEPGNAPPENTAAIPEQLRSIAHDVESGQLIGATSAVVIIKGAGLMVYGVGAGGHVERLNAAYVILARAMRELEGIAAATD